MQGDIDNVFDDNLNAYVVTYEQNDKNSVEGMINYVDATSGKIVKQEAFSGVDENGKRATIKKSFTATLMTTRRLTTIAWCRVLREAKLNCLFRKPPIRFV